MAFLWWELRVKNPIINVRLFTDRVVACGVSLMGLLGFYLYSVVFPDAMNPNDGWAVGQFV